LHKIPVNGQHYVQTMEKGGFISCQRRRKTKRWMPQRHLLHSRSHSRRI